MPRLKAHQIRDMLADALNGRVSDPEVASLLTSLGADHGATYAEVFVRQLVIRACMGDGKAISEVLDRIVGKTSIGQPEKDDSATYHDFLMAIVEIEEKKKQGIPVEGDPIKLIEGRRVVSGSGESSAGEAGKQTPCSAKLPESRSKSKPVDKTFEDLL